MSKAKQFIKDYTRGCSNELVFGEFQRWLTPEQALAAVELEKEETIDKAWEYINSQLNLPSDFEQHFRNAMKE